MKVSKVPATTPGSDSGKVTLRNVVKAFEYKSPAASRVRGSIRSSDAYKAMS